MIVGFQGEPGAFSEEAVAGLFESVETHGYATFDALVEAVDAAEIPMALLPCENSIHGPVTRAYDLLYAHPSVRIVDETVHRIVQTLIGVPGATLAHVCRVESHPVALEQCRRFLASLDGVDAVPVADTAGAVRDIVLRGDRACAAIGPGACAQRYGGIVIADAIQDQAENYTRFFAIAKNAGPRRRLGRAVLAFVLPHRPGSLHAALGAFAERDFNLRALVARPLPSRPFEYVFYAELDCPDETEAEAMVAKIGACKLLGWF